jgi:hypothetical protein
MTITTALCVSLLCASLCGLAQDEPATAIACNLKAIRPGDRPHYNELVKHLRAAVLQRTELSNGFVFTLEGKAMPLPAVAEWMSLERRCCPFLTLQLSASGDKPDWLLTMTGPEGVRAFLQTEFPAQ